MTAVEWLVERIDISSPFMISDYDIQKAKDIKKQQIMEAIEYHIDLLNEQQYKKAQWLLDQLNQNKFKS